MFFGINCNGGKTWKTGKETFKIEIKVWVLKIMTLRLIEISLQATAH